MRNGTGWSFVTLALFILTIMSCGGGGQGGPGGVNNPCFTAEGCTTDKACAEDVDCNDHEPCTEDRCDTAIAACHYSGLDQDDDGYVVDNCGGDDCDDTPRVDQEPCEDIDLDACNDNSDIGDGSGIHPGAMEQCNMQDDDCDGVIDNFKAVCDMQILECTTAIKTCEAGAWSSCIDVVAATEICTCCDGADNDQDGAPDTADSDCAQEHWCAMTGQGIPDISYGPFTSVWTGNEMIVWGNSGLNTTTGGRYRPTEDRWQNMSFLNAPGARVEATAVWTGQEMIVWGGSLTSGSLSLGSGAKYNPDNDMWIPMTANFLYAERARHTAVWTGLEMIIWGGVWMHGNGTVFMNSGFRYVPQSDSWEPLSTEIAPSARSGHIAVWTGQEMIVWGGLDANEMPLADGGRYRPDTNSWSPISTVGAPQARIYHTAVWTGSAMCIWGGDNNATYSTMAQLNDGACYTPTNDSWIEIASDDAASARGGHRAIWTGKEMIVWGGRQVLGAGDCGSVGEICFNDGARYNPALGSWSPVTTGGAPPYTAGGTAFWTGTEMLVWGWGTGGRYTPP